MKGNLHTRHGYEWNYNTTARGRPNKRGKNSTNKRARVSTVLRDRGSDVPSNWEEFPAVSVPTVLRDRGSDVPSNWEEFPAVSVPTHNWVGSHDGKPVYAYVG